MSSLFSFFSKKKEEKKNPDSGHDDRHDPKESSPLLPEDRKQSRKISKSSKKPLIHGSSSSLRSDSHAVTASAQEKIDVPTSAEITMMQIGLSIYIIGYMATSWFSTAVNSMWLFPDCAHHWVSWGMFGPYLTVGCVSSILVYWTFPIFCSVLVLFFLYRDLLFTRMYYVMFQHQVQMDFMNIHFFKAPSIRFVIFFWILSTLMYPLTGNVRPRSVFLTIPYWIPLFSFVGLMYTQWDLETRLMSVAKLVEKDIEWAGEHIKNSFFLRDFIAEEAFHKVREELDKQKPAPSLTSGEYIIKIAEKAEAMYDALEDRAARKAWKRELKMKSSKTIFHVVSPWYWGHQFLYSPYLVDDHAKNFHVWFRVFFWYTLLLGVFLIFVYVSTILCILKHQGVLPGLPPSWIDALVYVSGHAKEPDADQVQTMVTNARAVMGFTRWGF